MKLFFYKSVSPISYLVRVFTWRKHGKALGLKLKEMTSHVSIQYDDHLIVEGWYPRVRTRPLAKARSGIYLEVSPPDTTSWKEFLADKDFSVYDIKRVYDFILHPSKIARGVAARSTCDELAAETLVHCGLATKDIFFGLMPQREHFEKYIE